MVTSSRPARPPNDQIIVQVKDQEEIHQKYFGKGCGCKPPAGGPVLTGSQYQLVQTPISQNWIQTRIDLVACADNKQQIIQLRKEQREAVQEKIREEELKKLDVFERKAENIFTSKKNSRRVIQMKNYMSQLRKDLRQTRERLSSQQSVRHKTTRNDSMTRDTSRDDLVSVPAI